MAHLLILIASVAGTLGILLIGCAVMALMSGIIGWVDPPRTSRQLVAIGLLTLLLGMSGLVLSPELATL